MAVRASLGMAAIAGLMAAPAGAATENLAPLRRSAATTRRRSKRNQPPPWSRCSSWRGGHGRAARPFAPRPEGAFPRRSLVAVTTARTAGRSRRR